MRSHAFLMFVGSLLAFGFVRGAAASPPWATLAIARTQHLSLASHDNPTDGAEATDPLGPIEAGLIELEQLGFAVTERSITSNVLQGQILTARLVGEDTELMRFILERIADDGYQILLEPVGIAAYRLVGLRARVSEGRGVALVKVDRIDIEGQFRSGESAETLKKFTDLPQGGVVPANLADQLRMIGYRARFAAAGDGALRIHVEPGRTLRRVRIHGALPLPRRDLRRVLSAQARPGALARAQCVPPRRLRKARPSSICLDQDQACLRWEREEVERLERYLFDNGYVRGAAALGLACGRNAAEADLHVFLRKGKTFRAGSIRVTGNLSTRDHSWIRRVFRPTVAPFLPIPKRITRKHIEIARERVIEEYAEPRGNPATGGRRQLELPYPGVQIETNYDQLKLGQVPADIFKQPLHIDIQLNTGVRTGFLGNRQMSDNRLRSSLQLFERREPPSALAAVREAENLRNEYQSKGFMLATVEGRFEDFGTLKQLTFIVSEGPRVRIRNVDIARPASVRPSIMRDILRQYRKNRSIQTRGRFTDVAARNDLGELLKALAARGYVCATAKMRVAFWPAGLGQSGAYATLAIQSPREMPGVAGWLKTQLDADGLQAVRQTAKAGLYVRIEIEPGPQVVTSDREVLEALEIPIPQSREVASLPRTRSRTVVVPNLLQGSPVRSKGENRAGGIPLTLDLDRDLERSIVRKLRERGHPLGDAEARWVYRTRDGIDHAVAQAERLTSSDIGLCQENSNERIATVDTHVAVYEGRAATFGTTLVRGNLKTRSYVLRRELEWRKGDIYDTSRVDRTRGHIDGTGVVESVHIGEHPTDCELGDDSQRSCVVHTVVSMTESKDRFMDLAWGFGGATLDPLYGFVRPTFPNMWGTGWDLQLDAHIGANTRELRSAFCNAEPCYERSGRLALVRPRIFASPLTFDITGQLQRRATPARGTIDSALGQVRLTWPISRRLRLYTGYLIQAANISKGLVKPTTGYELGCGSDGRAVCRPPNRAEAIVPDVTGALQLGSNWARVDNAFNPDHGFILSGDAMLASPYLGGFDWWLRYELGWQHFIPIPKTDRRVNFRYMVNYGHSIPLPSFPGARTTSIPEVWRYFAGGTADLGLRGIEPQTMLVDIEEIEGPYGTATLRPVAQGAHIRALATVALQIKSVRNILGGDLAHSIFFDVGVVTQRWRHIDLRRDLRKSIGVNFIKWDIRIVTVALGYAILVPNRISPENVRLIDDSNGRFVFDVGATF